MEHSRKGRLYLYQKYSLWPSLLQRDKKDQAQSPSMRRAMIVYGALLSLQLLTRKRKLPNASLRAARFSNTPSLRTDHKPPVGSTREPLTISRGT